jgi:uncharacterized protein (TIGR03435 family)
MVSRTDRIRQLGFRLLIFAGTAVAIFGLRLQAQTGRLDVPKRLVFEVASVKPSRSAGGGSFHRAPNGITYLNVTLQRLLLFAFRLQDFQIVGGPNWLTTDTFDVIAKATEGTTPSGGDINRMLQSLLIDRFNLVVRLETKPSTIYALTILKPGMLGRNLHPNSLDCDSPDTPPAVRRDRKQCEMENGYSAIDARGWPLSSLIQNIVGTVGRPVVDRTGLRGAFDFSLHYNRDQSANSSDPSLRDALEQQLGLKLVPTTGPVEFLMVDKATRPTPN